MVVFGTVLGYYSRATVEVGWIEGIVFLVVMDLKIDNQINL
jgi:hypothetical protein